MRRSLSFPVLYVFSFAFMLLSIFNYLDLLLFVRILD